MATKAKTTAAPEAGPESDFDMVTYVPKDGDPVTTQVAGLPGIVFKANTPVKLPRSKSISQLVRRESTTVEGTIVTRHVEQRQRAVDVLRLNPWFSINDEPPAERGEGKLRLPEDPDQYRSWARHWIMECKTLADLESRWKFEDGLRERCGVSGTELRDISPFYEMAHLQLKAAEEEAA